MSGNTNSIGLVINSGSPLTTLNGGIGASNTFTLGSIPYINTGSLFSESNANLFLDTTNFNLYIGANSSTQSFQSAGRLVTYGTLNTNLNSITQYTSADGYPNLQFLGYNHGSNYISFDSYYATSWLSSNASSNFQIAHTSDQFQLNYSTGVAQGDPITWNKALYIDTAGVTHIASLDADVINFPDLDPTGIVTTDGSSNLVAVSSPNTYTILIGDGTHNFTTTTSSGVYYKIGHLYFITGLVTWNSLGSATPSSFVYITVPSFSGSSMPVIAGPITACSGINFGGANYISLQGVSGGSPYLQIIKTTSGSSSLGGVLVSDCSTTGALEFSIFYCDN